MLPEPSRLKKLARRLVEPNVNWVSLVTHAANQTPFKIVKKDPTLAKTEKAASRTVTETETDITRPAIENLVAIQKIEFEKTYFGKETALKYLGELNLEEFTLEESSDKITAKSIYYDSFPEKIDMIEGNRPGLRVWVGEIIEEGTKDVTKSDTSKIIRNVPVLKGFTEEQIRKYDSYASWWCDCDSMADALAAGFYDGIPPGAYEISEAFWQVVGQAINDRDFDRVLKASSDMGGLVVALAKIFTSIVDARENEEMALLLEKSWTFPNKQQNEDKNMAAQETTTKAEEEQEQPVVTPEEKPEKTPEQAPAEKENEKKPEEAAPDAPAEDQPAETAVVDKTAVESTPEEKMISALKSAFKEMLEPVVKKQEELTQRLDDAQGISRSKKAVEVTDEEILASKQKSDAELDAVQKAEKVKKDQYDIRVQRDTLGICYS